jgi:rhodanese-related sulfurtransferase
MRTRLVWIIGAAMIFAAAASASAYDLPKLLGGPGSDQQNLNTFKLIHVTDLASLMQDKSAGVHIYDANVPETREKFGVIPGAHLLASDDAYNVITTLPADKNDLLVFYCANTHCMASHEAARRATTAGYTDVSVMADGIAGWKAAGQPTVKAPMQTSGNS